MTIVLGGGIGTVAAFAHAGCGRFRTSGPLTTGATRRVLVASLGTPDVPGRNSQAHGIRAMAFETLVHNDKLGNQTGERKS